MKLPHMIPGARRVAIRSYSMWANYLGLAALIIPEAIYYFWMIDTNPRIWWVVGVALLVLGSIGRLVNQHLVRSSAVAGVLALFLAMGDWPAMPEIPKPPTPVVHDNGVPYSDERFLDVALPLIKKWEGLRTKAYRDVVGVWTVCYGETLDVHPGDQYTAKQCERMLAPRVLEHRVGWHSYLTPITLRERLHPQRDASFSSLAFNVGIRGAGTSTATRRLNNGDIAGACEASTWYNRGGQRVIRGLVRRRADEYTYCMVGVQS